MTDTRRVQPAPCTGRVTPPGSKSHAVRALLLAMGIGGTTRIEGLLDSDDARSAIAAVEAFGAAIEVEGGLPSPVGSRGNLAVTVHSPGLAALAADATERAIDVGNSGTTLYFSLALAALLPGGARLDGDASIRGRSAAPLLAALTALGARIDQLPGSAPGCVPLRVAAAGRDAGPASPASPAPEAPSAAEAAPPDVTIESPTSQFLSALLIMAAFGVPTTGAGSAAAAGARPLTIAVAHLNEHPYIDLTCRWLDTIGARYERDGYDAFTVHPVAAPRGAGAPPAHSDPVAAPAGAGTRTWRLPADWSAATFWACAAAITGGPVELTGLDPDDGQGDVAILDYLESMGVQVDRRPDGARIAGRPTRGADLDLNATPDALPALAALACYAPEPVRLRGIAHARAKETDRIAVMARELTAIGALVAETPDALLISPEIPAGGTTSSHGDHRVAMALAIAALGAAARVDVHGASAAAVTYPRFWDELARLAPEALA